jgi:hypothetical protein
VRWSPRALALTAVLALAQAGPGPYRAGGGPSSRALDQLERSVTRPLPSVPPATSPRSDQVWVPDRIVPTPGGTVHVPGHWERTVPSTGEYYVPPLVVCTPGGQCTAEPAGARRPPDQRQGP